MPEIEVQDRYVKATVEFEIFCAKCGDGICYTFDSSGHTPNRGMPFIRTHPCETCISNAELEATEAGKEEGYADGKKDGYNEGYSEGYDAGCIAPREE